MAADLELIGDQGRGAGDIGLHSGRRGSVLDDRAHRIDGLVRQRLALVAGQVQLHQGRFSVRALRSSRRERVPPEVLDVLDVLGVLREFVDQAVVVVVGGCPQRLITLKHDHRRTVRVEFVEDLADALTGLQRRCILWAQRDVVRFGDGLQLRDEDIRDDRQAEPEKCDQHRVPPDQLGNPLHAHPDLSRQ